MKKNRDEIIEYINSLKNYEGYVQFSNRPIEDIWTTPTNINIDAKDGFVYEAHFCNDEHSISIKQINDAWYVSQTDIKNIQEIDTQVYFAKKANVKMAQIWEDEVDELCEGMKVKKLKKVVFAGFDVKKVKAHSKKSINHTLSEEDKEKLLTHFLSIFNQSYINSILGDKNDNSTL